MDYGIIKTNSLLQGNVTKMIKMTHKQNITLPEIFDYMNEQETQDDKLQVLSLYKNMKQMKWLVNAMYNYDFTGFEIPDYTPNMSPPGLAQTINNNLSRLESAIKLNQMGKIDRYNDVMSIVLSNVSRQESLLLERILLNKKVEGVSKAMWKKIYPEFFRTEA